MYTYIYPFTCALVGRLCDEDGHVASASPTGPMLSLVVTAKARDRAPSCSSCSSCVSCSPSSRRFYETAHRSRRSPPPAETAFRRRSPNPDFPHLVVDRFIFRTHTCIHVDVQRYTGPGAKRIRISSLCGRREM